MRSTSDKALRPIVGLRAGQVDLNYDDTRPLMTEATPLEVTEALLERLRGRMSLIQPAEERRAFVRDMLVRVCERLENGAPVLPTPEERERFLDGFLSYGLIEQFLADPTVEDIMINGTDPIFLHRSGQGLAKTDKRFGTMREVAAFVKKLVVFAGRSDVDPVNDVELVNIRGRVNIIHSPFGPQITITRAKSTPLTMLDLIRNGTMSAELAAQLWLYVEGLRVRPANTIISGGPGTGKTTLLNALLSFIPPGDRTVVIEDTLELNTAFMEICSRLESCRRVKTPLLVKNSLRMRPERIIVGEVRGGEAQDLMTAMSLGKYCMGTVHASSTRETILRLQNEPMNVPPVLVALVDVFVVLRKLNTEGEVSRVVQEVAETGGLEQQMVLVSPTWSYDAESRRPVATSPSSIFRDRLAAESGRTPAQIMEESLRRARLLTHLLGRPEMQRIEPLTRACQRYIESPEAALKELGLSQKDLDGGRGARGR